jgi:hypothetical protein
MQWFDCRSGNIRYLKPIVAIGNLQSPQIPSTAGKGDEAIVIG